MISPNILQVQLQKNANKKYYYPRNALSAGFAKLLKQKTLTEHDLQVIEEIGFKVEVLDGIPNQRKT